MNLTVTKEDLYNSKLLVTNKEALKDKDWCMLCLVAVAAERELGCSVAVGNTRIRRYDNSGVVYIPSNRESQQNLYKLVKNFDVSNYAYLETKLPVTISLKEETYADILREKA